MSLIMITMMVMVIAEIVLLDCLSIVDCTHPYISDQCWWCWRRWWCWCGLPDSFLKLLDLMLELFGLLNCWSHLWSIDDGKPLSYPDCWIVGDNVDDVDDDEGGHLLAAQLVHGLIQLRDVLLQLPLAWTAEVLQKILREYNFWQPSNL